MRARHSQRNEVREKEEEARRGIPRRKVNAIKRRSRARRADVQAGGRLVAKSRIDNKTNYAGTAIIKVAVDAVSSGGRQRTGDILDRAESQSRVSAVASCRVVSRRFSLSRSRDKERTVHRLVRSACLSAAWLFPRTDRRIVGTRRSYRCRVAGSRA